MLILRIWYGMYWFVRFVADKRTAEWELIVARREGEEVGGHTMAVDKQDICSVKAALRTRRTESPSSSRRH